MSWLISLLVALDCHSHSHNHHAELVSAPIAPENRRIDLGWDGTVTVPNGTSEREAEWALKQVQGDGILADK